MTATTDRSWSDELAPVATAVALSLVAVATLGSLVTRLTRMSGLTIVVVFVVFTAVLAVSLIRRRRAPPARMRIVLTGGGTGGHVYPAIAILRILERADAVESTLFLGVRGRAEETIVPREKIPLELVAAAPFAGGSPWARLRSLLVLATGTIQAIPKLLRFKPQLVVATGGYVSAPVIIAAFLLKPVLGVRIVVHEQNLVPGLLNKVGSILADAVLVSHRESAYFIWSNRCVFAGYPVRDVYHGAGDGDAADLKRELGFDPDAFLILVYGGSLGARSINRLLAASVGALGPGVAVVHGIGMMRTAAYNGLEDTRSRLEEQLGGRFDGATLTGRDESGQVVYRGFEYLHDLIRYQRAADLIVCRAGAGSLAETMALGKASCVLPKRGLPGDHQELNAIGLAEEGAAEVLFERRDGDGVDYVDPTDFVRLINELRVDDSRRAGLEMEMRRRFHGDTDDRILDAVRVVMAGREPELLSDLREPRFVRYHRQFDALVRDLDRGQLPGLYRAFYDIKVEEYLAGSHYLTVNKGVKLIGALRRVDLYPWLIDSFAGFQGFLKRNALVAVGKAEKFDARFATLIVRGLDDDYYEARREAVVLFRRFHRDVAALPETERDAIHRRVLGMLDRRFESFEVKAEAIRAMVLILDEPEFVRRAQRFVLSSEVRYREALLGAIELGLEFERLPDPASVRQLVGRILITTSEFNPVFGIRKRYERVLDRLRSEENAP